MLDEQLPIEAATVPVGLAHLELSAQARRYARDARAQNTKRAYLSDTMQFTRWCVDRRLSPLPATPSTVANYLSWLAVQGRKVATIHRALAAISQAHRMAGLPSPRGDEGLKEVMKGIRRTIGAAQVKKAPVLVGDLRALLAATGSGTKGTRDRALLSLGFAGAFRRSELVDLDIAELDFTSEGLEVTLRKSKTDQEGAGTKVGIPYGGHPQSCPVRLTRAWLDAAGLTEGPLFRPVSRHGKASSRRLSGKAVASVVQQLASRIGLDPTKLGAHSLRAGLATTAIRAGKQESTVMRQTRHKSVAVFRGYVRHADLFRENAAAGIGL
jgi:site-specific recombinase XerD